MSKSMAITIGNFDGVHRGHQALIAAAREAVDSAGRLEVFTFDPHPVTILRPEVTPQGLGTIEQRCARLVELGVDSVTVLNPADGWLLRDAESFVREIVGRSKASVVVEGSDFRFGAGREGDLATLRRLAPELGYSVIEVEAVSVSMADRTLVPVASTRIRQLIRQGRVDDARRLLGQAWTLRGTVVRGEQRGRELGVPTANIAAPGLVHPADGVYAGRAVDAAGVEHRAAISVGGKPTFGGDGSVVEVHLLDWVSPLDQYGWTIDVTFDRWLRGPIRFSGTTALRQQIDRDLVRVRDEPVPGGLLADGAGKANSV